FGRESHPPAPRPARAARLRGTCARLTDPSGSGDYAGHTPPVPPGVTTLSGVGMPRTARRLSAAVLALVTTTGVATALASPAAAAGPQQLTDLVNPFV